MYIYVTLHIYIYIYIYIHNSAHTSYVSSAVRTSRHSGTRLCGCDGTGVHEYTLRVYASTETDMWTRVRTLSCVYEYGVTAVSRIHNDTTAHGCVYRSTRRECIWVHTETARVCVYMSTYRDSYRRVCSWLWLPWHMTVWVCVYMSTHRDSYTWVYPCTQTLHIRTHTESVLEVHTQTHTHKCTRIHRTYTQRLIQGGEDS